MSRSKAKKKAIHDVAIVGGGPAGTTLACLLGLAGVRTALIDREPIGAGQDLRTTAVSYGSRKILDKAGLWACLENTTCPIHDIQILDGDSPMLLQFLSEEVEGKSFGWIAENANLRQAALRKIKSLKAVTHKSECSVRDFVLQDDAVEVHLDQGEPLCTKLVIGADGRGSFTREWMGVGEKQWSYNQRAIICTVAHEHPHDHIAVEHFHPGGPFAILPMSDDAKGVHRSSVVFTEHGPKSASFATYDTDRFLLALKTRFPDSYGNIKLLSEHRAYPLNLVHAHRYIAPRVALVADAAHGIHPIAGQGLNLGYRDVAAIADLITDAVEAGQDPGAPELLEQYQRLRRFDNMRMAAVTDGLVKLFSNNISPVRLLRRAGLKAVSKLIPAKRFFMKQAMGDQ